MLRVSAKIPAMADEQQLQMIPSTSSSCSEETGAKDAPGAPEIVLEAVVGHLARLRWMEHGSGAVGGVMMLQPTNFGIESSQTGFSQYCHLGHRQTYWDDYRYDNHHSGSVTVWPR